MEHDPGCKSEVLSSKFNAVEELANTMKADRSKEQTLMERRLDEAEELLTRIINMCHQYSRSEAELMMSEASPLDQVDEYTAMDESVQPFSPVTTAGIDQILEKNGNMGS